MEKKRRENEAREKSLNENYSKLYTEINKVNVSENTLQEFYQIKADLENFERHRARGSILRSKAQWAEEGEKNSSYFLRLENNNYCNKHITQLQIENEIITNPQEILLEEKIYHEKLYTPRKETIASQQNMDSFIDNLEIPTLDEIQKQKCENLLTEKEVLSALKAMKNGKSPGTDGLTCEFYKFFWIDIKKYCFIQY